MFNSIYWCYHIMMILKYVLIQPILSFHMKIKLLFCIICLLSSLGASAQVIVSGKLLNEQQKPIGNVTVSYKKIGSAALLGFSRSNADGSFKLAVKIAGVDSVQLDFNHLSYAKHSVNVVNATANYAYILKSEVRQIQEVKVADVPIYKRKDTLNYNVSAFTSKQDRVIADIIKKLPGIEMRGDEILYQGKAIQKFKVNNLDLMEGRYAMINNNLPAEAVKKVQVVENDQPIKILDSLVFSDRASLNLELKKFTTTGVGKVSAGGSPPLWDINLTPMTFGKTFQMLNSLQSNNIGVDVSKDLRSFYTGTGYFNSTTTKNEGPSYISIRNVASPDFDEKKWLNNKIFLFSNNVLQKLKNGIEFKGNFSYYDDTRKRMGFTTTTYFANEEQIISRESVDNRYRIKVLDAGVLLEKNEKDIYLRNSFKYNKRWNNDHGNLLFNDSNQIDQRRYYTDESLLNSLSIGRFIGKQLVSISSNIGYNQTPQSLLVNPGQFEDILNQGKPYDQLEQQVVFKGLSWTNNVGMIKKIKNWRFSPRVEINYNSNTLETKMITDLDGHKTVLDSGYYNDMRNSELNFVLNMGIFWERQKWKFSMGAPFQLRYYNVKQQGVKTLDNILRNTFNPTANLTYIVNGRSELSINGTVGKEYGGLDNFYNGYIVSQYRNMQRYDARLLQTNTQRAGLHYQYKNTLKATFGNVSYSYSKNKRDYIYTTRIDDQGRTTTSIEDRNSMNDNHSLSGGISKLFVSIKTVVKLNGNLGWSRSDYFLNGNLDKQSVSSRRGSLEIINNLSSIISGEYKTTIGQTNSRFAADMKNQVFYNNHYFNLVLYPGDKHALMIYNSFYRNNIPSQRNQYFLDATYRYRVDKWRTDIELTANNLWNNNQYVQQYVNNYEWVQSYFELRPRQFLISTRFKF